VTMINSVPLTV